MQQPETKQIGSRGETAVELFFEDLGWGPMRTGNHDLGTDLFVQVRTSDLVDLGTMIGVQVKTGDSFLETTRVQSGRTGWWLTEGKDNHESYWLNHHVPHILVLQSEDRKRRFWAFLDSQTVMRTGVGIKVFVPEDQPLDESFTTDWAARAADARRTVSFEGSRWNFRTSDVPATDLLRYALLTPRLVVPHPNRGYSQIIGWEQAVAMTASGEEHRWEAFADTHDEVPSPSDAVQSAEWGWRFAAAFHQWVFSGSALELRELDMAGRARSEVAAHAVVLASALADTDRSSDALKVLDACSDMDDYSADQGWLGVRRGRLLVETGHRELGVEVLTRANAQLAAVRPDVTTSAIQAAGIFSLFQVSDDWKAADLDKLLPALDTTAGWWLAQNTATGLKQVLEDEFRRWGQDKSFIIGGPFAGYDALLSNALVAQLTGAHDQWRQAMELHGAAGLLTGSMTPFEAMDSLRRAGADKKLTAAIRRLRRDGPLSAVSQIVASVSPETSTRTSVKSDLAVLKHAGAYCTPSHGKTMMDHLLGVLENPGDFRDRFAPRFSLVPELFEAIEGLRFHWDHQHQSRIVAYIVGLETEPDQLLNAPLTRIVGHLGSDCREKHRAAALERMNELDKTWFYWLLVKLVGVDHEAARAATREGMLAGSYEAFASIGTVANLKDDEAAAMLASLRPVFQEQHDLAARQGYSVNSYDRARWYTLIALWFPDLDPWAPLLDFLKDPVVWPGAKRSTCKLIASQVARVPAQVRLELEETAKSALDSSERIPAMFEGQIPKIEGGFFELYLSVLPDDALDEKSRILPSLLLGGSKFRLDAADYLARTKDSQEILLVMSRDGDRRVANRAQFSLAVRASEDPDLGAVYVRALTDMLEDDGEEVARAVLDGIRRPAPLSANVLPLAERLRLHPSAAIRTPAQSLAF